VIEKIKKVGRRFWFFVLKAFAIFLIYLFGATTAPTSWDLRNFVVKIAHDPRWTVPVFITIAVVIIFFLLVLVIKIFFSDNE